MKKYEGIYEASLSEEMLRADSTSVLRKVVGRAAAFPRFKVDLFDLGRVDNLMNGAIDVHTHPGPDPYQTRLADPVEMAIEACEAGMAGIVFKAHFYPSAPMLPIVQRIVDQWAMEKNKRKIKVLGGVVLNYAVGGLNPEAVIISARLGGKYVWTPNQDASHRRKRFNVPGGIDVLDENDDIVPQMKEILDLIGEGDLVLGLTGGQSTKERFVLIDEAKKMGIKRIEVIHPNQPNCKMTIEQMKIAADKGAYIGLYCHNFAYPTFSWDEFMEAYKVIGPDRVIAGTDEGVFRGFHPVVSMRHFITGMLYRGIPDLDVEKMVKTNPKELVL